MKKIVLLLFILISQGVQASQVRGELRTEINGFQWYCYQGKEAFTKDGKELFSHLKGVRSISFSAADKNDKGFFVIKYKGVKYKRTGAFDPYTFKEIHGVNDDGYPCNIYSVALTFSNPIRKEYYVRADIKSKYSGPTFNNSELYFINGNERAMTFNRFEIKDNFIIFTWDNFSYATRFDGKELTNRYGKIVYQGKAKHFICSGSGSYYTNNEITIVDSSGNILCKGIKDVEYGNGFIEIENDKGRGLMSFSGNWIVSPEIGYREYKGFQINNQTYCRVKYKNTSRYYLLDSKGKDVLGKDFEEMEAIGGDYLRIKNNGYYGVMTLSGKDIIPTSRRYTSIDKYNNSKGTFAFTKRGLKGICNTEGKEISTTRLAPTIDDIKANGGFTSAVAMNNGSKKYYKVSKSGRYGLTDSEGRLVIPCEMEGLESAGTGFLKYKLNGFWGLMNYQGKILIDTDRGYTSIGDYKSFNKRFAYTMNGYKGECDATGRQISKIKVETPKQNVSVASSSGSSSSSSSSFSSSSSSNGNSGNKTTTVVVEHHRDPVPVQEWVQCTACWGSGTCPDCAGSGTKYVGSSLKRCWRCGGRGKCSSCSGQGGRYYTVYK